MAVLGVPVTTKKTLITTEWAIDNIWWQSVYESLKEAAGEEKTLAVIKNSYHDGTPAISVVWMHGGANDHANSYNAMSGVGIGIVIGFGTKKLLDVGVWNKFCSIHICGRAESEGKKPTERICSKYWDRPSSLMERAFQGSESKRGSDIVGDRNSSIFCEIFNPHTHPSLLPLWNAIQLDTLCWPATIFSIISLPIKHAQYKSWIIIITSAFKEYRG